MARYRLRIRLHLPQLLLGAALSALVIGLTYSDLFRRPRYRSWNEVRERYAVFDIVQEPAGTGPFAEIGSHAAGCGQAISGTFHGNGAATPYHVVAGADSELRVLGLLPRDGSAPTYAILRPRYPSFPELPVRSAAADSQGR